MFDVCRFCVCGDACSVKLLMATDGRNLANTRLSRSLPLASSYSLIGGTPHIHHMAGDTQHTDQVGLGQVSVYLLQLRSTCLVLTCLPVYTMKQAHVLTDTVPYTHTQTSHDMTGEGMDGWMVDILSGWDFLHPHARTHARTHTQ